MGYTIETGFYMLTTSLTAQQFIDARELADCSDKQLPLLASIYTLLYPMRVTKHINVPICLKLLTSRHYRLYGLILKDSSTICSAKQNIRS